MLPIESGLDGLFRHREPGVGERQGGVTLVDEVPAGNGWLHEYKYDGYRQLLAVGDGVATAWTRNGKDWSDKFKALVKAAARLPAGPRWKPTTSPVPSAMPPLMRARRPILPWPIAEAVITRLPS